VVFLTRLTTSRPQPTTAGRLWEESGEAPSTWSGD
jgi:hypothetical protein